jgi:archaetidylinositol phosphate synthase
MVLNRYRSVADRFITPIAKRMIGVKPDTLSWLAFAFAVLAGVSFWAAGAYSHHLLLLAFMAILLNAGFDALDGWVARLTGVASKRGDFLDHVLDRYADAFIFGGIVLSAYCNITIGLVGLLGVFFTSYMGTQAQALGLDRDYGGILGRADRLVLLLLATLGQWVWVVVTDRASLVTLSFDSGVYVITILEALVIWVAIAGHLTAIQRGRASWRSLSEMEMGEAGTVERPDDASGVTVEVVEDEGQEDGDGARAGTGGPDDDTPPKPV